MRVVVLGSAGMLGRALLEQGRVRGLEVLGLTRVEADVRSHPEIERRLVDFGAGALINCAAFTDVDGCESAPERALEVNGRAVEGLARLARRQAVRLVQISSDYVFDGRAETAYREDDGPAPLSVYGHSKLLGERAALGAPGALVVRTSWLFGPGGRNFVATILRAARSGGELRVVGDQVGAPTYAPFLAGALLDLIELGVDGIVHYRNRDAVSWHGFAREILEVFGVEAPLRPVTTAEFPRPASRPAYSVLDVGRFEALARRPVEGWREGLLAYREVGVASEPLERSGARARDRE